ncbi:MAG: hypothetical protein EBR01_11775 [Proteobacteria bacterium]|nr:hypothetical protein [Pseudomonadota bacterium]NBY21125.1 hypothetical protein [bacterium]
MLKRLLTLTIIFFLASCGKSSPTMDGVDLAPDGNAPVGSPIEAPSAGDEMDQVSVAQEEAPAEAVKIFNAPIVLIRGAVTQQQTAMDIAPGT